MIKSDYHMHSSFSGDSKAPMDTMIDKAKELNLDTICFTEHYDPLFPCYKPEEEGEFDLDTNSYLSKAALFRNDESLQSKINVNFGIELGIYPGIYDIGNIIIEEGNYDFVICSSHTALKIDPYYPEYWKDKTVIQGARDYFAEILTNVQNFDNFDVYGHLDYCMRYIQATNEDLKLSHYEDIFEEIFKILIEKGKGIEINSNGLRSSLKQFNPNPAILKLYKDMGGEIVTFGSDAHSPEYIAYENKKAEELLLSLGFKYHVNFKSRKPEFISLL